jgi:hypothetical protein
MIHLVRLITPHKRPWLREYQPDSKQASFGSGSTNPDRRFRRERGPERAIAPPVRYVCGRLR